MTYIATITSQRQITIPANLFSQKVFRTGDKVLIESIGKGIRVSPAVQVVRNLAGSISLPLKYKGLSASQIKEKALKEYFTDKDNDLY